MVRPGWEVAFPCRAVLLFRFAVHLFGDIWALAVFQPPIDGIGAYPPAYANFAGGKISTQDHILYGARVYARHPDGISTACAAHISILRLFISQSGLCVASAAFVYQAANAGQLVPCGVFL